MKIKPNLFLNMSPQTTEEGGLAFARNMKLDDDGNLISDYGYKNIISMTSYNIVGHIVGLDNKVYFFTSDNKIVEYDEVAETATELTTQWTYNGGEIDGYVNTNQSGEKILTIGEYLSNGTQVPLKHINLKFANVEESLYSQAPKCPTANLVLTNTYVKTIPNGVYVFFIRYKIRKDVYTNWFLCSRPIFGGTSEKITTLQGGLSYINLHRDSAKSFVFHLDFAQIANIASYKEFQLGFIITHDEATDARTWKHFNMSSFSSNGGTIYFDYEDVAEANIDDLLETTYELYNVRNVTAFKNKLYISNYIESNFNPSDISSLASKIHLQVANTGSSEASYRNMSYNNYALVYDYINGYYSETVVGSTPVKDLFYPSHFNFDVTNLTKIDSKEKAEALKFDIYWNADNDPDLAAIYNIYNNLYNKAIFGDDYSEPYGTGRLGITELYESGGLWIFGPSSTPHPWYDLDLSFIYGSATDTSVRQGVSRNGVWYFNKNSRSYTHPDDPQHREGWPSHNTGFDDFRRSAIKDNIKKEITDKGFFAKAYIQVSSGAKVYNIGYEERMDLDNYAGYNDDLYILPISYCTTSNINSSFKSDIKYWAYIAVQSHTVGIDESGIPVLNIDGNIIRCGSISIIFKRFEFVVESDENESSDDIYGETYKITLKTTDYASLCTFNIKPGYIKTSDNGVTVKQESTLMPFSKYKSYVHFVDENNIITNGVYLQDISTGAASSNADVLYLKYKVDTISPGKYKSFFISLISVGNIVMEGFNYCKDPNNSTTNIVHCLEVDTLLYNINDNIIIVTEEYVQGTILEVGTTGVVTTNAKYYSSGSSYPPLAFGNCGYIAWEGQASDDYSDNRLYIIIERNKSSENINNLEKASSYIPLTSTNNSFLRVPDGYYGSWLCLVKKPSFDLSSTCYVAGNDVYAIDRTTALKLTEFKNYIQIQSSVTYFVRSNYNLNYLSTTEDIADKIFSIGSPSSNVKQVAKVINSATLSFIYELKSMYKDFSNKYFRRFDSDYKIDFDNTIRVSHVLSDETFNNSVFKFSAEDYYNVPTDRGVIVNLFSIGNNIFVHTKSAFYKFDGNQTISSNNQDIKLQESEPFETGITQIFDSEYGYGGIDTKQSGCITFDSYFFYDKASNHLFAYGGNSQVQLIDGNIYKLLAYYKPADCKTVHDELNCRVLFEFASGRSEHASATYKTFTISYNYKTKTFVSFHDLSLVNAFAGRHRAYSYKSAFVRLFEPETAINTTALISDMNINQIFGGATTACIIEFGSKIYKKQTTPFGIAIVLLPQNNIKEVVDSVKYIADIQQTDPETQSTPVYDVLVNPQVTRTNPVVNFYIVTDSCVSSLVNTNVDDTARPNSLLDYKGFKYDMGFWVSNYFRNNINKTNIYDYPQKYPNRTLDADNNSLVYGRYFIFVFDFKADTPIKFEEIFMNIDKY